MHTIIYLNGTSSSGKTTVAKALHKLLPDSFNLSADDFGEYFETIVNKQDEAYRQLTALHTKAFQKLENKNITPKKRNQLFSQLYDVLNTHPLPDHLNTDIAFYKEIGKNAKKHPYTIVDDLISTEFLYRRFLQTFTQCKLYLVKVFCPLNVLDKREQARGDRILGMAHFWAEHPIVNLEYDVEIDTAKHTPDKCAQLILDFVIKHPKPQAFNI